jgi:hypothetical protein
MLGAARILLAGLGITLLVVGVALVVAGLWITAIWLLISGAILLLVLGFERRRYRSEATERAPDAAVGPGGGEPDALPANFQRTDERFVDPTSGRVMRVYIDGRTGERRYRAEA